jgi:hypothetical protein
LKAHGGASVLVGNEIRKIRAAYRQTLNRLLKISQLLRRYKKFKLLRISKYAATLNFLCSLHLEFLNSLSDKDFFNTLLRKIAAPCAPDCGMATPQSAAWQQYWNMSKQQPEKQR